MPYVRLEHLEHWNDSRNFEGKVRKYIRCNEKRENF